MQQVHLFALKTVDPHALNAHKHLVLHVMQDLTLLMEFANLSPHAIHFAHFAPLELINTMHLGNVEDVWITAHLVWMVHHAYNVKEDFIEAIINVLLALLNAKPAMMVTDALNVHQDLLNKLYLWMLMFQVLFIVITVFHVILIVWHAKFKQKDVHHVQTVQDYLARDVLVCSQLFMNLFWTMIMLFS